MIDWIGTIVCIGNIYISTGTQKPAGAVALYSKSKKSTKNPASTVVRTKDEKETRNEEEIGESQRRRYSTSPSKEKTRMKKEQAVARNKDAQRYRAIHLNGFALARPGVKTRQSIQ